VGRDRADVVIESTGFFTDGTKAKAHLDGGAKKVIISAPAKNDDFTVVMGVNDGDYDPASHHIISNASCTTNCLAPMAKVLDDEFGIVKGLMTTIHAYTQDQNLQDGPHTTSAGPGAAINIVPTSTGAAEGDRPGAAAAEGQARRLRAAGAGADRLGHRPDLRGRPRDHVDEVNAASRPRRRAAQGLPALHRGPDRLQRHRHRPASCIFDAGLTKVIGNQVKVVGWYDNEWGYSNRLVDLVAWSAPRSDSPAGGCRFPSCGDGTVPGASWVQRRF
jgi:glyceraldehyde 3-phosphate dehydrogenase